MKEKTSCMAHVSMNGVGKLLLGHAKFKSWKSVQTRMVPCFLLMGLRLETQVVYVMGYMKLVLCSFSILSLTAGAFDGWVGIWFWCTGITSGHVLIRCSMIEGFSPRISVYDKEKISWNSWKIALYEVTSSREKDALTVIYSTTSGVVDILTLMVGEILALEEIRGLKWAL